MLVTTVRGNAHEIAVRMLADLLEMAGWNVIFPGGDLPADELAECARRFSVDLVVLSATLSTQIAECERVIRSLAQPGSPGPPVLVGGAAFAGAAELWRRIGASGTAADFEGALLEASRLAGLSTD